MASLLNRSPEIAVTPETHFFRNYLPSLNARRPDSSSASEIQRFLSSPRIRDLRLNSGVALKRLSRATRHEDYLPIALELYGNDKGKIWVGEKTPAHIVYFSEIFEAYGNKKFIYIVRDGRDCALSNMRQSWTHRNPVKQAAEWSFFIRQADRYIDQFPEMIYKIYYEDLVKNPEEVIASIGQFLGLRLEWKLLANMSSDSSPTPKWEQDWKGGANLNPNPENVLKWRNHADQKLISKLTYVMKDELGQHGYDDAHPLKLTMQDRLVLFPYRYRIYSILKDISANRFMKYFRSLCSNFRIRRS